LKEENNYTNRNIVQYSQSTVKGLCIEVTVNWMCSLHEERRYKQT